MADDRHNDINTNEGRIYDALRRELTGVRKIPKGSKTITVTITKTESFSPDFVIDDLNGIFVEAKGKLWKERRATYQEMAKQGLLNNVVFLFYNNTKPPGISLTALGWAKKFGIKALDVSKIEGVTLERVEVDGGFKRLLTFSRQGRKNLVDAIRRFV